MRFGKKGNFSPRYIGPYDILDWVGYVAYGFNLPHDLASIHLVFYVSMLKKCVCDLAYILPLEGWGVDKNLSYEEVLVERLHRQVKRLRNKEGSKVKVL